MEEAAFIRTPLSIPFKESTILSLGYFVPVDYFPTISIIYHLLVFDQKATFLRIHSNVITAGAEIQGRLKVKLLGRLVLCVSQE